MVAYTMRKALPDLTYIALNILLIMPILAVLLSLFETHHTDGFFTYRGESTTHDQRHLSSKTDISAATTVVVLFTFSCM